MFSIRKEIRVKHHLWYMSRIRRIYIIYQLMYLSLKLYISVTPINEKSLK